MSRSRRFKKVCLGLLVAALAAVGILYRVSTTRAGYLLDRGRAALARDHWSLAERYLELLEARGYRNHAHLLRGECWLRKARLVPATNGAAVPPAAAQSFCRRALQELGQIRDEGELTLQGALAGGECLVRLGERRFAAEVLHNALKRAPDLKEAHQWLAAIYMDLNSPAQAIRHLREWGRLEPHNGRPYRWIGWFLSKDYGKLDEAIDVYREACRRNLDPALRAEVSKELAAALVNGPADYQAALEALTHNPELADQPEILTLRAQCLWNLARQAEALQALTRALERKPELPEALRLRAKLFLAEGQPKEAVPLLEKALAADPHDLLSRQLLMQACMQVGDKSRAEAERRFLEASRASKERLTALHDYALRHPWDAKVRNEIADLCLKLNLQAEAQMWRQAAAACAPSQTSETTLEPFSLPERN